MKNKFKVEIIGKDLSGRNQLILSDQKISQREVSTINEAAFQHPQIQKKQFLPIKEQEFTNVLGNKKLEFNKLQMMLNHKKKTIDVNSQRHNSITEQKQSLFQRKDNAFGMQRHSEQLEIIGNRNVYEFKNKEIFNPYDFKNVVQPAGQSIKTLKFSNTSEEALKDDRGNIQVDDPDKLNQIWLKNLVKKDFQFQKNQQKISIPFNNMLNKLPLIKDDLKNQDNYGVNIDSQNSITYRRKTMLGAHQVNNILNKLDSHRKILKQQNKDHLPELIDIKYSMSENRLDKNILPNDKSEYSDKTLRQNKFVSLINFSGNEENQDYIQNERHALTLKLKNKGSFRQASVLTMQKGKKDGNRFHFTKLNPDLQNNQVNTQRDQGSQSPFDKNLEQLKANMKRLKNEMQNKFKAKDQVDVYFIDPSLKNQSKKTQNESLIVNQEIKQNLNDQVENDYFHIEDQKQPKTKIIDLKKVNEEIDQSQMMSLVRLNNNHLIKTMGNSQVTKHPSTSKQGSKMSMQKFSEINVNVPNDSHTININSPMANSTHTSKRIISVRNQSYENHYSTKNIQKDKVELEDQSLLQQSQIEQPIENNDQIQIQKKMAIEENSVMNSKQNITKSLSARDLQDKLESNYNSIFKQIDQRKQSVEQFTNNQDLKFVNFQASNTNDHQSQISQQYLVNKFQMLNKQSDSNVASQNDIRQNIVVEENFNQEIEQKIVAEGINLNDKSQQANLMKQDPQIIQAQSKKREKIDSVYKIIMHRNENSKHEENFTQKLMEKGMSMADQLKQQRNLQEFRNLMKKKKQKQIIMQEQKNLQKRLSNDSKQKSLIKRSDVTCQSIEKLEFLQKYEGNIS